MYGGSPRKHGFQPLETEIVVHCGVNGQLGAGPWKNRKMGRTVSAVVTYDGECAGKVGPFEVGIPWWAEVEPVVAYLEQALGGPAVVLRLLSVEGSDGARDGHVTYLAEAEQPPRGLAPCDFTDDDQPLRHVKP